MSNISVVIVVCFVGLCSAAPKIETSSWDNLLQVGGNLQVTKTATTSRSSEALEDFLANYIKSHEVAFDLPGSSTVSIGAQNLDNDELSFKLNFDSGSSQVQARKKSKIKKIFVPILVFILIKAMTLIPLALAILGLKTWNALQLSFVSFVMSVAMAVWKICSKVSGDHHPHVIHEDYDPHHHHYADARSDPIEGMQMAYNGYNQPQN